MFESVKSRFGGIDVIVNNAAIDGFHDWDKILEINLVGLFCEILNKYQMDSRDFRSVKSTSH